MEGRDEQRDAGISNSMNFSSPSPVKLPLAPLFSSQHDRRGNVRRGSSIFSPTQTLDPPLHHRGTTPSPPRSSPIPNPDPPPSNSRNQSPPPPPAAEAAAIRYKECQKNHAAAMGGHVVDGCGEFMPSGDDGTPQALRCAACDCHRNFHRRETEGQLQQHPLLSSYPGNRQTPAHHRGFAAPPTMVSFGGGGAVESSSEDLNMFQSGEAAAQPSKKRFRTKFRQDQKERMHEFATKLGWRLQKQDEEEVQEFCSEIGVKRQAFKIWMHNNKQAIKKRSSSEV